MCIRSCWIDWTMFQTSRAFIYRVIKVVPAAFMIPAALSTIFRGELTGGNWPGGLTRGEFDRGELAGGNSPITRISINSCQHFLSFLQLKKWCFLHCTFLIFLVQCVRHWLFLFKFYHFLPFLPWKFLDARLTLSHSQLF